MEQRRFNLTMATLVGLLLLSTSPLGAMLGLLLAFTVGLFVAPIMWIMAESLGTDLDSIMRPALISLGVAFAAGLLTVTGLLVAAIRRGDAHAARRHIATLAVMAAVPAILWLSSEALADAWP
ncbi:MAG: hypothetical protein EAY70_07310 [Sphingomonadales bacterium]|nr:MAG: hypothetical protein EAY70_07310 [Sphingomonadales bacterium]